MSSLKGVPISWEEARKRAFDFMHLMESERKKVAIEDAKRYTLLDEETDVDEGDTVSKSTE